MRWAVVACVGFALGAAGCSRPKTEEGPGASGGERAPASLKLSSKAFSAGGEIPQKYSCEGSDVAPPLEWSGAPAATKSFVLMVTDPDAPDPKAPKMTWVHWLAYDLPPDAHAVPEGGALPAGARSGKNDWKRTGFGGPCPPIGRHRYFHQVFALDTKLGDIGEPTRGELEKAMKGHVLARGELIGTYQKKAAE